MVFTRKELFIKSESSSLFSLVRLLQEYLCGIGGTFWLIEHGRGDSISLCMFYFCSDYCWYLCGNVMADYSGWQRIVGGTQYLFLCPICVRFVICFSLFRLLLKYLCGIGGIFWLTKHGRGNSIARFVSVTHWLNFSFLYSCPFPVLNSNNNTCKSSFSVFWCQNIIHSCVLSIHSLSSFDEIAWTLSIPLETSTLSGLLLPRSRD